ncbi:MAG: UDP-glucose 4-epimerase GalE [Coriobacteriia bacterium]|nr:UDP-glucose 4-epimerase GalE [Coriobacteriia bacterium]
MRFLVTGGAGYIGSITVRTLLDAGHEVIVLDTLEKGWREAVDRRARVEAGDVGDRKILDWLLPGCDAVMHLAGYIEVAESQADPGRYFENNVSKPLTLLRAMVDHGVGALVFSSTAAVYGIPAVVPILEDAPTLPVNAYGSSKLMFEQQVEWFAAAHGLRAVRLRYFNVAGAWPDGTLGESHDPETHIIPRVLRAMADGQERFEVFGDDYPTPDGTCVRDYIHVCDLAGAHRLALERVGSGGEGGVFNLGNGRGYSNLEVVRACARVSGREVAIDIGPRRAGDPPVLVASHARAQAELGWTPERGDLDTMIEDAWRWHSTNPNGYAFCRI